MPGRPPADDPAGDRRRPDPDKRSRGAGERSGGDRRGAPGAGRADGKGRSPEERPGRSASPGGPGGGSARRDGRPADGRGRRQDGGRQGDRPAPGGERPRRGDDRPDGPGRAKGAGGRGRSDGERPSTPGRDGPRELPAGGRGWGGLARKGTQNLGERKWEGADHADRPAPAPPEAWEPDRWVKEKGRDEPVPPSRRRPPRPLPPPVADELQAVVGPERARRVAAKLADGVRAFERDHFDEARQLLQPIAGEAPAFATVRELLGLTYYRLGRWRQAVRELEAFAELSSSTSSHAVLADANRALGRHRRVQELWEEMKLASEDPATVTEGRIVAAGSLADQDRLADAIALLEKGRLSAKHPEDHHLRLWYALADLYERAGEVPRARDLFERVARHDPGLVDVVARRRALG